MLIKELQPHFDLNKTMIREKKLSISLNLKNHIYILPNFHFLQQLLINHQSFPFQHYLKNHIFLLIY